MENTKKLQTDQILKEFDSKNSILTKLLNENILRKFSKTPSQNDIIGVLTRQPCKNLYLQMLHKSSPPQCQDFNAPTLNRNASVNRLEKDNAMKIAQCKKRSIIGNEKTGHQEYMLNSSIVITDCNKNKGDTVIHRNIKNKKTNESINKNDTNRVKTKTWPKGTFLVTEDSMFGQTDETQMSRKFNVKVRTFPGAKTEDIFHYLVPLLEKIADCIILHVVQMMP